MVTAGLAVAVILVFAVGLAWAARLLHVGTPIAEDCGAGKAQRPQPPVRRRTGSG